MLDTETIKVVCADLRAELLGGVVLRARYNANNHRVEFVGGRHPSMMTATGLTRSHLLERWEAYLEAHGVDVGRRWITDDGVAYLEARGGA